MKLTKEAIVTEHSDVQDNKPYAMLGAGRLCCMLFKNGDEQSGWEYQFTLFHMDADDGVVSQSYEPEDIERLAKLVRLLAFELANDGCMEADLRDDLYCLSACLDEVLPADPNCKVRAMDPAGPARAAVGRLLDYLWDEESRHFGDNPSDDHIYRHLAVLRNWLAEIGAPGGSPLVRMRSSRSQRLAGCPICGKNNGYLLIDGERWSVCHSDKMRWLADNSSVSNWTMDDRAIDVGETVEAYLVVQPIPPASE